MRSTGRNPAVRVGRAPDAGRHVGGGARAEAPTAHWRCAQSGRAHAVLWAYGERAPVGEERRSSRCAGATLGPWRRVRWRAEHALRAAAQPTQSQSHAVFAESKSKSSRASPAQVGQSRSQVTKQRATVSQSHAGTVSQRFLMRTHIYLPPPAAAPPSALACKAVRRLS